jgi:multisubunit Na+/H+ antiporter MnhB subunit
MLRFVARILSLVPLVGGLALLALALVRYRLPYEHGRYFDPQAQVVYRSQTAEVFLIGAIILIVSGLGIACACFRFLGRKRRRAING